jgi:hypothetical protein
MISMTGIRPFPSRRLAKRFDKDRDEFKRAASAEFLLQRIEERTIRPMVIGAWSRGRW